MYGALAIQDLPLSDITKQRFVMVGAGSAGMGVTTMLSVGMQKHVRSRPALDSAKGLECREAPECWPAPSLEHCCCSAAAWE